MANNDSKKVSVTLKLVKDETIGYCDPETGICVMPVAVSDTKQAEPADQHSSDE